MERSQERRLALRCLLCSIAFNLLIAAWILFIPAGSSIAFVVMFPALWLTSTLFANNVATSDSGPENLIRLVLAGSLVSIVMYSILFFLCAKIANKVRGTRILKHSDEDKAS
jgi:hypothetical protein